MVMDDRRIIVHAGMPAQNEWEEEQKKIVPGRKNCIYEI